MDNTTQSIRFPVQKIDRGAVGADTLLLLGFLRRGGLIAVKQKCGKAEEL